MGVHCKFRFTFPRFKLLKSMVPLWMLVFLLTIEARPFQEELANPFTLDPGFQIYEGDMLLTPELAAALYGKQTGRSLTEGRQFWPNATVPYVIDQSASSFGSIIEQAIDHWQDKTCLKFVKYVKSLKVQPHVIFRNRTSGCSSLVGMGKTEQYIDIGNVLCHTMGRIAHEIGHAIGFLHEQNRIDRNQSIRILDENIDPDHVRKNFAEYPSLHNYSIPYDFDSVMHYPLTAFSINGKNTIIPIDPRHTLRIGQRDGLSFYDAKLANLIYKCSDKCNVKLKCQNEGYLDKTCKCRCPESFKGKKCRKHVRNQAPKCGGIYKFPTAITTPNFPYNFPNRTRCIWMFEAPIGKRVKVYFPHFDLMGKRNKPYCVEDTLHIRGGGYNGETTYCGDELKGVTLTTTDNILFLMFKSDEGKNKGFKAWVKFVD